jgi:hypothetical protein
LAISDSGERMEHLWSQRAQPVATGGEWDALKNRSNKADPQPVATHGNRFAAHGKEGVDGSSPSEGSAKSLHVGNSSFRSTCSSSILRYERFCAVTRAKGCATPLLDGADFNILGAAKLYDGRCRRAAALCRLHHQLLGSEAPAKSWRPTALSRR